MVETVASEKARSSLILMAQCWHRLAREAEDAERRDVAGPRKKPALDPANGLANSLASGRR